MQRFFMITLFLCSSGGASLIAAELTVTRRPLGGAAACPYGYLEYLPHGYDSSQKPAALIVCFHGNGDEGDGVGDLKKLENNGVGKHLREGNAHAAIILCPQAPRWFDVTIVHTFIEYATTHYHVDPQRIYLVGHSAGGSQVWNFAHAYPNIPAAIVPICGASNPAQANNPKEPSRLAGIPVWAFHNFDDPVVGKGNTIRWLNGISAAMLPGVGDIMTGYPEASPGKSAAADCTATRARVDWNWMAATKPGEKDADYLFTLYREGGHNAWTKTYANPAMWEWLLAQKHGPAARKP